MTRRVALLLLLTLLACKQSTPKKSDETPKEPSKQAVFIRAQVLVQRALKAPSTAKFGSSTEYQNAERQVVRIEKNRYRVTGWVDAQNSFGAQLRTHWLIELRYLPKSNDYEVVHGPVFNERSF